MRRLGGWLAVLALVGACGSPGELGEDCSEAGDEGECVEGAVCGTPSAGVLLCLQACDGPGGCPAGQECAAVSGDGQTACRAPR